MKEIVFGGLSLYELFAFFFVYSFLGWVVEVAFHAVTTGKFINRGFLNGPVCPIYGTGVALLLLILGEGIGHTWLVLLVGIAFPTLIELITGWVLEKFFHNKWWDYSGEKFNFKGYICLRFSLIWGFGATFVLKLVHPFIAWLCDLLPDPWTIVLSCAFSAALIADFVVTVMQVAKLNRKLAELDEISRKMRVGSDYIGKKVTAVTLAAEKGALELKEKAAMTKEELAEWTQKKAKAIASMPKRLLKAFPGLRNRENQSAVEEARAEMASGKKVDSLKKSAGEDPISEQISPEENSAE